MSRRAVYTGSFDPITLGHLNVIERSSRLVDELIVGIGTNIDKQSLFTADERVELIRRVTDRLGNVVVKKFDGLAVRFVRECDARVIIRGVRSLSDMEAEFTMTLANRKLDAGHRDGVSDGRRGVLARVELADQADHAAGERRGAGPLRAAGDHSRSAGEDLPSELDASCTLLHQPNQLQRDGREADQRQRRFDAVEPVAAGHFVPGDCDRLRRSLVAG